MAVYYILMALILGLAYPMCIKNPSEKKNTVYVCIVFGYMLLMSVFRYGIGNDFFTYRSIFYRFCDSTDSLASRFANAEFEPGYTAIMQLGRLLGGDYLVLNLIMSLLILVPTAFVIIKYSKIPWLSCWLYLTVTFFYNSMNFTRQTLAASIVLLTYPLIKSKKHWAVILVTFAASLFHTSVLLFIPVYLLSLIKPSPKAYGIIGGAAVLVFVFSKQLLEFVLTKVFTGYAKYLDTVFLSVGLSPVFLIIPFLFMALAMASYFTNKDRSYESGVLTNFLFYNFLIWLFITKHFILERFTLPIYIFILISIPEMIYKLKDFRIERKEKGTRFANKSDEKNQILKYVFKNGKSLYGIVSAVVVLASFTYNDYCVRDGVHGVFPYRSVFDASAYSAADVKENYRQRFPNKSLQEYLSMINNGNYTTVICVNGDAGDKLDLSARIQLKKLGMKTDLNVLEGKSYLGVFDNGKALYEIVSEDIIEEKLAICDNSVFITAASGGMTADMQVGTVYVDGMNYTPNMNGLNIAVFDNDLKKIAAAQTYDTSDYSYTCTNTTAFYGEVLIEE